jgi:hypothetical protein
MQLRRANRTVLSGRHWFVLAVFSLLFLLSVQYSFKALDDRSAILRWRPQILELDKVNIYERYTYPNPPIMPLLLKPIVALPPLAAALCWFYMKLAMALAALWWSFGLVEGEGWRVEGEGQRGAWADENNSRSAPRTPHPSPPTLHPLPSTFPALAKGVILLLCVRNIMGDLSHGNVNLFILFLVTAALYAFHQKRDTIAGLSLALAIACKVTPALFVPYFLWKRAWKMLAGCALGLALFLFVVPGWLLGMERNAQLLTSWYRCMVQPYARGVVTTEHINQSLPGLVYRWASHSPSAYDKEGRPLEYLNLVDLDPRLLAGLVKGCMALFAIVVLWTCRTPTDSRASWRLAAEYSLVMLGMLLFSERTWKHHCVTLMLPFTVLVYYYSACRPSRAMRRFLVGSIISAQLLMASTSAVDAHWNHISKLAEAAGAYVWCFLILAAALVVLLRRPMESEAPFEQARAAA